MLEHLLLPDGGLGERPSPARPASTALWDAVATAVRLDEPDPSAAWEAHIDALERRSAALTEHRFDAIRFRGPGTDLTIGLLPKSRWKSGTETTVYGVRCVVNMPTEEVFTTPDRAARRGRRPLHAAAAVRGRAGRAASRSSSRAAASSASTPTSTPSTSAARWRATRAPPSSARSRW